ncbi:iron-containing alcohol dehydrogenase [Rathayibacter sp. VKM Ac-2760]|uniref:iron-containing alcohol dehydrogenase n=1 Tax=Rathayibacter sp. VKM Ac-2760 TaxID=2609253 RepID=UPI001317F96A|nr:iron-containing alcohol dehydrogenase [Rathayibacter sp. VKM Ac-2760]QHC59534.1 iron-containing alcohol dehydrogenase [Rathayibacter sp. VKM Ac-2760]
MNASIWCPTRVTTGEGATSGVVAGLPAGDATLVVADTALLGRAERVAAGRSVVPVSGAAISTVRSLVERLEEQRPAAIVALGGGSVLDAVKVAVATGTERLPALLRQLDRGPISTRRPLRNGAPVLIAVPTTLGTASEVSPIACVTTAAGHRLVAGDDLRPQLAVLDPEQLSTLPARLVREGALEMFLRVAGTAASGALSPVAFDAAVDLGRRMLALGDRLRTEDTTASRGALALLSAESRWSWSAHPIDPFVLKHWYPANELAWAASISKIAATLLVLPRLWALVLEGERRLGDRAALERFWREVRPAVSASPSDAVLAVAADWGIAPPPDPLPAVMRCAARGTAATWVRAGGALSDWDEALLSAVLGPRAAPTCGDGRHSDSGAGDPATVPEIDTGGR